MDKLEKMLSKRKKHRSEGKKGEGKLNALKGLREVLSGMMGGHLGGLRDPKERKMKQVSVMSDTKKGVKEGLKKAQELMGEKGVLTDKDKERQKKK